MAEYPPDDTRAVPHSMEAEEAVIGSVLIDPESIEFISLDLDAFYIHRHRFIWGAIQAVRSNQQDIDIVTLSAELERRQQLAEVGGSAALYDLMARTPNAYNIESYADIIRNTAASRTYLDLASKIANQALNGGVDVAHAIEVLTSQSKGERDGRHISAGLDDLEQAITERMANPVDVWGIPTGFIDWDLRNGGLKKQQVRILSGESGTGKTTILLQAALYAAKEGYGAAIFEEEMSEASTLYRLVELESSIPYRAMQTGRMSDIQFDKFKKCKASIQQLPIYINDDPVISTADIRRIISRVRMNQPVDAIYHDYLSLLGDTGEDGTNDWDQTKAKRFREVCRSIDVAGFTIQDMVKAEGAPVLRNMSGGAKVRFGADEVYFITQDADNPTVHYLIPAKERHGDIAKKFVTLYRKGLPFQNAATDDIDLRSI